MGEGKKYDKGKLRFSLFPVNAMWAIIEVMEHGAAKYGEFNWTLLDDPETRYTDAMQRHLRDRHTSLRDKDSGLMHSAHIACNAVFLLWFDLTQAVRSTEDPFLKRFANEEPSDTVDSLYTHDHVTERFPALKGAPTQSRSTRPNRKAARWEENT